MAEPDVGTFGTRRDRPVVVYPLRNDQDPDCDALLISDVELEGEDAGTLGIIDGGRAVQVDVASDVDGLRFDYTVTDGRGGRARSEVTVDVVPEDRNEGPVLDIARRFPRIDGLGLNPDSAKTGIRANIFLSKMLLQFSGG